MKIAYISECSPLDVQNWSGTPFYVFNTLSKNHTVVWIGENMTFGAYWHHKYLQRNKTFFIHDYCPEMGKILSDKIKFEKFDLIITSVYIMASDLDVDVPIIYFSDIIYESATKSSIKN